MEPKVGMHVKKFNSTLSEAMKEGEVSCIDFIDGGMMNLLNQKGYKTSEFSPTGKMRLCDEKGNLLPMDGIVNSISATAKQVESIAAALTERIPCDHEKEIARLKDRYNLVLEQNRKFEVNIGLEHQERVRLEGLLKEAWAELGRFGMLSNVMRRERDAIAKTSSGK